MNLLAHVEIPVGWSLEVGESCGSKGNESAGTNEMQARIEARKMSCGSKGNESAGTAAKKYDGKVYGGLAAQKEMNLLALLLHRQNRVYFYRLAAQKEMNLLARND